MGAEDMYLKVLGEHGQIDARALHHALGGLLDLMAAAGAGSTEEHPWVVSDLAVGSVAVGLHLAGNVTTGVLSDVHTITRGIAQLHQRPGIPAGWRDRMLNKLIAIGNVASLHGVDGVQLSFGGHEPVRLDGRIRANAKESLSAKRTSLGSVRGRLHRYSNTENKRYVGVEDPVTGESVTVLFDAALQRRVVESIEKTVLAWGTVSWNGQGQRLRLRMEDFEILGDSGSEHELATRDMAGYLGRDWTGGLDSVSWVREQRRED